MIAWWQAFGLHEMPFGLTPDTQYFFPARSHADASVTLYHALQGGEGFVVVSGEVGTGKTLILRRLLNTLPEPFKVAFVPNPSKSPCGLTASIAQEFGVAPARTREILMHRLEHRLIELAQSGCRPVVMIDEAQAMPPETLEAVRLLANLETEKRKLLQVVLFGQPELMARLHQPGARQSLTRISFHMALQPLSRSELGAYLNHRLHAAGSPPDGVFSPAAIRALYRTTRGLPRVVNIVAAKSMMLAYGEGISVIQPRQVHQAAADTLAAGNTMSIWRHWFAGLTLRGVRT